MKTKYCRVCGVVLTPENKYHSTTKGNGSICYQCYLAEKRVRHKSRTIKSRTKIDPLYIEEKHFPGIKAVQEIFESRLHLPDSFSHKPPKHCRVCNTILTSKNKYRPNRKTKGNGSICYSCHLAEKRARYQSRLKLKFLYIEENHYPRSKVVQELPDPRWRLARSFSDMPKKENGVWKASEFMEFEQGRAFFTSPSGSRLAREGFPSKVGTRVGMVVEVRQNNEVTRQYQHQVCDERGSDYVRIDSRGYKYCTKCFLIQ